MYLTQSLHRAASALPRSRIAMVFRDRRKTYAQLHDRVARLARSALQALGMSARTTASACWR